MTSPGRNAPCPCGSGRKFKQCHGGASADPASPEDRTWERLRGLTQDFPEQMFRFVRQTYGAHAIDEAWDEFVLWDEDDPGFDPDSHHLQLFMPWFYHGWAPDPLETVIEDETLHDRAPTEVFLEKKGRTLLPLLRRYLTACVETPFSFHEILEVEPGVGFRSRELFTGDETDVIERTASRTFQAGDTFFGQVVRCDGIAVMEACGVHAIPPIDRIHLIELRGQMSRDGDALTVETLRDYDIEMRETYLDLVEARLNPPAPIVRNADGDEIAFHDITFETTSAQQTFDALKELAVGEDENDLLESAEWDAEGGLLRVEFPWLGPGARGGRATGSVVLGGIEIDGTRLVLRVNSAERADRLRRMVESRLEGDIRHLSTEVTTMDEIEEEDPPEDSADEALPANDPESREIIRQFMANHYRNWVSEPLPALGGQTPLEAVRTRDGREKVEALVAQLDADSRRADAQLDPAIVEELRRTLGLE